MGKVWSATEVGKMIGISGETVKLWEREHLIPVAMRIGRKQKRIWGKSNVLMILEYARDMAGYPIPGWIFEQIERS